MEDDDIDRRLVEADEKLWEARVALYREVGYARDAGWTWSAIGEVLGVTRQAAQERFGRGQPERSAGRQSAQPKQLERLW